MKVLTILPSPFFADRGCSVRVYEQIKFLKKLGCEITLVTYHNGRDLEDVNIKRIVNIPWYNKLEAGPSNWKYFLDILLLFKVFFVSIFLKPDIIHAHLHEGFLIGFIVSKILNKPIIFDCQGSLTGELLNHGYVKKSGFKYKLFNFIENLTYKLAKRIITSSSQLRTKLLSNFKIDKDKILTVSDGVDTDLFKPVNHLIDLRKALNIPKDKKIVSYIGLLNEYQGLDFLLEVIEKVVNKDKSIHFLIMGYPNLDKYKKMANEKNIFQCCTFTGKVNYEQANSYLNLSDIAVSPKMVEDEANGKLLNYLSCGLPTIVFDNETNREILKDNAIYVVKGDVSKFAESILELMKNDHKLQTLRKNGRIMAEKEYSYLKCAEKIFSIYSDIVVKH